MMHRKEDKVSRKEAAPANMARALGWLGLGVGLADLLFPQAMARQLGMEKQKDMIRAYGLREMLNGFVILSSPNPAPWIWVRLAGGGLDLVSLAPGLKKTNSKRLNVALAMAAVIGVAAFDAHCARKMHKEKLSLKKHVYDYSDRIGFPDVPENMRGLGRDVKVHADMRAPDDLQPWTKPGFESETWSGHA